MDKLFRRCSKTAMMLNYRPLFISPSMSLAVRSLHVSKTRTDIFKIQDEKDYQEKVLANSSKKLVILDFFATWCGPCRQLIPRLETLVGGHVGTVDLAKVDVDELDSLAAKYKVTTIPAVFAIKNGKVVDQFVGSRDEDQLKAFIDGAINK